jgi:hypothetical protein
MSTIFGALNLNNTDFVFNSTVGQEAILTAIRDYLARRDAQVDMLISVFVEENTENFSEKYKLSGTGRMQDMGFAPKTRPGLARVTGEWDVSYPLGSHQSGIGWDRISMSYFTTQDLERHVSGIDIENRNTVRFKVLRRLFRNTTETFNDPNRGNLTIQPAANGDTVVYPPVIGSESEATEDHYLESGYSSANISDTNNPYVTIEADLVHHFGKSQGNDNVAVFINSDEKVATEDLTDFVEITDYAVIPGTQTATLTNLPTMHPGRVIGRTNGCWVIEWDWIPSGYMLGIHLDAEKPLKRRVDPANTGLSTGLSLVFDEEDFPHSAQYWENRYGFGHGNRLNLVAFELGTGGTYTIPTAYQ